jgi:site-specific DNA recombinase
MWYLGVFQGMIERPCDAVAIYAGPPSPSQRFEISVRQQVAQCWKYSNKRGWNVESIFVDQGNTGRLVKRANFRNMLNEARTGKFAIVVFYRLEFLCCSRADFIVAEKSIRKSKITFHNATKIGGQPLG